MKKIPTKQIEKAVDATIEDMKNIFPFRKLCQDQKTKNIIINETKVGLLRYIFLKNLKIVMEDTNGSQSKI